MHSYRFLVCIALSVLLIGALSAIDLAVAGQRPDRAFAQDTAGPLSRLAVPELPDRVLDGVSGQPEGQGFGGFQFGGGFQGGIGGGFQFGGAGLQGGGIGGIGGFGGGFNLGGGFQAGGFQFGGAGLQGGGTGGLGGGFQLGGGGLQGGFGGGFQGVPGVLTPRGWVPILGFPPPPIILPPPPSPLVPVYVPQPQPHSWTGSASDSEHPGAP